ncbi:hypothetical protein HK102_004858 [Quaeritorhiza haematococci]|nr:hypothetical protein HK102_004858 [Quaeritorhiza haematococci]
MEEEQQSQKESGVKGEQEEMTEEDVSHLDQEVLLRLEKESMHPSWFQIVKEEIQKPYFLKLKSFLESEFKRHKIFPPNPYFNDNQAHGLAFSVQKNCKIPPTLKNIYKALEAEFPPVGGDGSSERADQVGVGGFRRPDHGYLGSWADQDFLIKQLNDRCDGLVFLLWGLYAHKKGSFIDEEKHLVVKSSHPSGMSAFKSSDSFASFFEAEQFKKANEYLEGRGKMGVEWSSVCDDGVDV